MITDQIKATAQNSIQRFLENNNSSKELYKSICIIKNGEIITEENTNLYLNFASTSKPFLIKFLGEALIKYRVKDEFKLTKELVEEIIQRKKFHFFENDQKFKAVLNWTKDNSKKFPEVYLDFEELAKLVLSYSSNIASILAKDKLDEIYSNDDMLQKEFESMKIAPTLELNKGGYKFWEQSGANTGKLKDITLAFDNIMSEQSETSQIIKKSLRNIKSFGIEKDLLKSGKEFYAKDGIIWPIVWGKKLSDQGFPPHLSIGALLHIVDSGDKYTLGYFLGVKVKLPEDIDFNKFPEVIEDPKYNAYISFIKQLYNIKISRQIRWILKRDFKNIQKDNIHIIKMWLKLGAYAIKYILSFR